MGDDAMRGWTPAPALTDEWVPWSHATGQRWTSACGRVKADVSPIPNSTDWMYGACLSTGRSPWVTVTVSEGAAKRLGLEAARKLLAELDAKPAPAPTRNWDEIARSIAATVAEKNVAYGDSFERSGEVMAILYPNGIPLAQMGDALAVVRVLDKLFRIASDRDAFGESPWRDIAGYALLAVEKRERKGPPHRA